MEKPHDGVSDKPDGESKKSHDDFNGGGNIILPKALQPVITTSRERETWEEGAPAGSRFLDRIGHISTFYHGIIMPPVVPDVEHKVKFTGNVIVEKNHNDVNSIVSGFISYKVPENIPTYNLINEFSDIDQTCHEEEMRDAIEHAKVNAPSFLIASTSALHSKRFVHFFKTKVLSNEKVIIFLLIDELPSTGKDVLNKTDFVLTIDHPTVDERAFFLAYLLGPDPLIDHAQLASKMDGWTWDDIEKFCKQVAFQQHAIHVKEISTKFLLDLVEGTDVQEAFVPPSMILHRRARGDPNAPVEKQTRDDLAGSRLDSETPSPLPNGFCDPFKEQLWQVAASCDYHDLVGVLERIEHGTITPEDKALLAKYPFVLQEDAITAKTLLDAARNKVDLISRTFKTKKD